MFMIESVKSTGPNDLIWLSHDGKTCIVSYCDSLGFWAVALKGMKSCRTQGESVRPYVRLYVRPPLPHPQGFVTFGAYSDPNSAKQPKSKQYGPNLGKMAQIQA